MVQAPIALLLKGSNALVVEPIKFYQTALKQGHSYCGAVSRGRVVCRNAKPDTLDAVLAKLREAGS